jgi:hypothetical protein
VIKIIKNNYNFLSTDDLLLERLEKALDSNNINKSYLLFWLLSIFEEVKKGRNLLKIDELCLIMIAHASLFFKTFEIEASRKSLLNQIVDYLDAHYDLGTKNSAYELTLELKKIYSQDITFKKLCDDIFEFVPYQSLVPFLLEPKGINNSSKLDNSDIENLSKENSNSLYSIDSKNNIISINGIWFRIITREKTYLKHLIFEKLSEYYSLNFDNRPIKESESINEANDDNRVEKEEFIKIDLNNFESKVDPNIEPLILRDFMNKFEKFYEQFKIRSQKSNYEKLKEMFIKKEVDELINIIKEKHYRTILKMYKKEPQLKTKVFNFIKIKKEEFKEIVDEEFQNSFLTDEDLLGLIDEIYRDLRGIYSENPINYLRNLISSKKDLNYIITKLNVRNVKLKTFIEVLVNLSRNPEDSNVINQLIDFIENYKQLYTYKSLIIDIFEKHVENVEDFNLNFLSAILSFNSQFDKNKIYEVELVSKILTELGVSTSIVLKVKRYLFKKQLKEFFESSNERFEFWRTYLDKMVDVKKRKYYQTEAIIMYFSNYDIVEFKDVGNALYIYEKGVVDRLFDLKNKELCYNRLSHQGNWQRSFREYLRGLGV